MPITLTSCDLVKETNKQSEGIRLQKVSKPIVHSEGGRAKLLKLSVLCTHKDKNDIAEACR